MTESEAIKWQEAFKKTYSGFPKEADKACDMAISALEEIQQYRALGTIEELREAMEKQRAKKGISKKSWATIRSKCPACGYNLFGNIPSTYCPKCGQHIDWSEEE